MPVIEIFGIHEDDFRCNGCIEAKKALDEAGLEYEFNRVLSRNSSGDVLFDRPMIEQMAKRAGFSSLNIAYPVIFIDNQLVRIKNLRSTLSELGYDVDVF